MTELEGIWTEFLLILKEQHIVMMAERKIIAGTPFLYISAKEDVPLEELKKCIFRASKKAMLKKRVTVKTVFVRRDGNLNVFRHRFFVPQEKMFCCGNLCPDCVLLKKK
ncbi:hypothetical protein LRR81_06695 [Metabacillus sp. GX 13764]|uniref:hypothetical protein n=1 Tax=Metabacillus kandeliae TaxID=2900151 RepID=UPI001E4791AD|nr:hypothetical protein [Metabacillus kandeliae]MCD7033919.1 hypothetical protein [Metabacillus kandeliae]